MLLVTLLLPALPDPAVAASLEAPTPRVAIAKAGDDWKAKALKPLNIAVGAADIDGIRSVAVVVDRVTLRLDVPTLQEHGALSKRITLDEVEKRPASYNNALSLLLTSYAVRELYNAHPDLGVTRWKVALSPAPLSPTPLSPTSGDTAQVRREMFAFSFDRPRYESIDWDRLAFTDFPRAAASFSYNLRFTLEMSHEVDGSIDED